MWTRLVRDVLSPLLGIVIVINETLIRSTPRELAVTVGLVLIGVPIDAAVRLLSRLPLSSGSSEPTPPSSQPSSEV